MSNRWTAFLAEARRRRVFRTVGVYVVAVWGLSQGAIEIGSFFGTPEWMVRALVIGAVCLLPVVVVLAWRFDIGRSGIVRDPHDVAAAAARDDAESAQYERDIAHMSTMVGGGGEEGAVIVRWGEERDGGSALFTDEFVLGRAPECRVRFYDPLVSRRHARVYHEDGAWRIEDLGSRNGTRVDGERVSRTVLPSGCEVRVNEAGPVLRLERVAAGEALREALERFPTGPMVAHVRHAPARIGASATAGARATLDDGRVRRTT